MPPSRGPDAMTGILVGQILRFGAVGAVGFVVDGGLLWVLTASGTDAYLARAISFPVAVVVTWALNRNWTFRATKGIQTRRREFSRYFGVQAIGSLTNYAIYASWIAALGASQAMILTGFVIGSAIGAIVNFLGARHFAFHPAAQSRKGNDP